MKVEDIKFQSAQHVLDEIYNMNVKGGSPFGRAAAWAYKLACEQEALDSFDALEARMQELSDKLHELKPTMATIRNSSVFARGAFDCAKKSGATLKETKAQIIATCDRIIESSYAAVDALAKNGIGARKYFYPLTNTFECFHNKYDVDETPVALHVAKRVLTLPLYSDLALEDVDRICKIVLELRR